MRPIRTARRPSPSTRSHIAFGAAGGSAAAALAHRVLKRGIPGGPARWQRTNHRGRTLTLLEGPSLVIGSVAALVVQPGVPARARAAGAVALLGAGALGGYDDLAEHAAAAKGFRGHLGALARRRLTPGAVKLLGIGATGLTVAAICGPPRSGQGRRTHRASRWVDIALGGAVVAGYANLVNLLDLRPGRALKFGLAHSPLMLTATPAAGFVAPSLGAAAALLPSDLAERSMLGDAGANGLGALLGTAVLLNYARRGRLAHLIGLAALNAASEAISFTEVIAATPVLRRLDELGRRP